MLDEFVQTCRNTKASERLLRRLLWKRGLIPKRINTDQLVSYGAAKWEVMPGVDHWSHKSLNNRAKNSHVPLRKREQVTQGFRSQGARQRLVHVFSAVRDLFVPPAPDAPLLQRTFTA